MRSRSAWRLWPFIMVAIGCRVGGGGVLGCAVRGAAATLRPAWVYGAWLGLHPRVSIASRGP